jgi:hypothetical protein
MTRLETAHLDQGSKIETTVRLVYGWAGFVSSTGGRDAVNAQPR